jgi:hypothetical protein
MYPNRSDHAHFRRCPFPAQTCAAWTSAWMVAATLTIHGGWKGRLFVSPRIAARA